jgi:aryl-alcohol dehydrogenase-like predicted oxidoreductase
VQSGENTRRFRMSVGTRKLGRTGIEVSEIGHGMWGMGSWSGSDDRTSLEAIRSSAEEGCTFYDSAWAYGNGRSDRLLGEFLRCSTGEQIVTSKVPPANRRFPASPSDAYGDVFPHDHVIEVTRQILGAIGIGSLPLLQLHVWDDGWVDSSEFVDTVAELKERKLIDHIGISLNRWEPWNGIRAVESGLVDTVQVIYNIFDQAPEDELFPACRRHGVGVIARVPLDEGSLGGELTLKARFPAEDWRSGYFGPENLPETVERVGRLRTLLPEDMTLPEMALRFVLSNADVSTVIVGMREVEHVRDNMRCSERGPLPPEFLATLRHHRWDREVAKWAN